MENYLDYNFLSARAHEIAVSHGFWDVRNSDEHCIMLTVCGVSDMVDAERNGRRADTESYAAMADADPKTAFEAFVEDTMEDGMADVMIRLGELAGAKGIDFDKLLPPRYFRIFTNFSFTENGYALLKGLCREDISTPKRIQWAMRYVQMWAETLHVKLDLLIKIKMEYNAGRKRTRGEKH